ncbi:MAG TPA: cold shock domain-containing protein [Stellaceae bacterium]|nr:cold shock domain-containing protein [Stellaceae bacterium]
MRGRVKFFDAIKGFGFLVSDDSTIGDAFVGRRTLHESGITELRDGATVEYEFDRQADGRIRARNLILIEAAASGGVSRCAG